MQSLTRWMLPAVLAAALGAGALAPAPAQAQDRLAQVLVDVADVVFNGGTPYYRYGDYGPDDRLVVGRDAYGHRVYYRQVPYAPRYGGGYGYDTRYRAGPPYGRAYGYYRNGPGRYDDGDRDRHPRQWRERRWGDDDRDEGWRRHERYDDDDD